MTDEELYQRFVDQYFEGQVDQVPEDWSPELRKRCLFFLRFVEEDDSQNGEGDGVESVLARLEKLGISTGFAQELDNQAPPVTLSDSDQRYHVEDEVARGGMGRILLAYDRDFRRRIAMKVMLGSYREISRTSRFIQEAQTTAQLEHPNIGPVYDIGIDVDQNPFFTMKWIRGRNLSEVLRSRSDEYSLTRLIQTLQQAAMGIHFANSKGVVHRDLKPQNIMLGDFGEVLVVDWGLAKVLQIEGETPSEETDEEAPAPQISTNRVDSNQQTLDGVVQGSVPYMAPEQASGEVQAIDNRTDVFGLGAILYEILTGTPPYIEESVPLALSQARQADVTPPRQRAPDRSIPVMLEEICLQALAREPSERFPDAKQFHDRLQHYIEGIHTAERQTAEANRLYWVAEKMRVQLRSAEEAAAKLTSDEAELRAQVSNYDPEEKKKHLWELMQKRDAAEENVASEFTRTTAAYLAVLSIDPEHRNARAALAGLFYERLVLAEGRGSRDAVALYKNLVEQYDDGRFKAELSGEGRLLLDSDPAGATVLLCRFERRGHLLAESQWETAGTTPLEKSLPQGSYVALLWKHGHSEVRFPFVIDRSGEVVGKVQLAANGTIPDGFIQVPGGYSVVGSDSKDYQVLPRERVHVDELFVGRFPVTFEQYCRFLDARFGETGEVPPEYDSFFGKDRYIQRSNGGRFVQQAKLDPRMPVLAVPQAGVLEYCRWLGETIGKEVRLLTEREWERCARGADGRTYPWGNGFDWALCKGALSRAGEPFPDPVGTFPSDMSVFGIQDLAGTVRELCAGWAGEGYRPCRGGSWFQPIPFVFRTDFRTIQRDGGRSTDCGFRVCYSERK